ncbi:MAG: amidohydrolase family protein, partial [Acetobacteraceae bacterium]|nr:amidohydrolase family protein [Acetobacteraceae bacterium]
LIRPAAARPCPTGHVRLNFKPRAGEGSLVIIDFHNHVEYKTLTERWGPKEFVAGLDAGKIDKAVVLGVDQVDAGYKPPWAGLAGGPNEAKGWLRTPSAMPVAANLDDEAVAEFCSQYPDRLIGFASLHPERYRPDLKVERAIKHLGLKGVKIYPHAGFYPNDPRLYRAYQKCVDLGAVVMFHTGIKALRWQWLQYNNPVYVDQIATDFPDMKIVMCHGGFPWADEFLVVAYSNPNIYVDITFMDYVEKTFRRPGLVESTMRQLVDLIGPERLLWGSEGPAMFLGMFGQHDTSYYARSQEYLVKRFDFLTEQDKAGILGGNAARLLGLK